VNLDPAKQRAYEDLYKYSISHQEEFWAEQGKRIDWIRPYRKIKDVSFDEKDLHIRWFYDGTLNACYNCLDRHLPSRADTTALIWEGDDARKQKRLTYGELHELTCKIANVLKSKGVKKGDRVTIYLPLIPEAIASMLACARIGAIHSVVFGGFSSESLANRINDCDSKLLITADGGFRGGKAITIKEKADQALLLDKKSTVETVLVVRHCQEPVAMQTGRDYWLHEQMEQVSADCPCEEMDAEDPLFILYTSGSTGKPKGALHTTGGYMVYASLTHEKVFDYRPGDVYWCTADIGWITGHTYSVYGPLANGATCVLFEGIPTFPDYSRFWQVVDNYKVNILYTAPTAIRSLMREGDGPVLKTSRASLRILGSVGEPINETAWEWYHDVVGQGRCPIVDTWWQTETGGILITPIPYVTNQIPGSATHPFLGIKPALVNQEGKVLEGKAEGALVMLDSWPGQARTIYGDHTRFYETYFKMFPGMYLSGDGAKRDEEGNYWITGRMDDIIKVSGHRLGTAEIESSLDEHHKVAETAIVGYPHDIKGQGIYAFVTLNAGIEASEEIRQELIQHIRKTIGPVASPDFIQFTPELPKTRSGKIMRRILRKIACDEIDEIGDTSTLANPEIVQSLIENRAKK
jgi:acetyl-CoA synthetase